MKSSSFPLLAMARTTMRLRRGLVILLVVVLVALVFSFSRIVAFAHLFGLFGAHAGTRISQLEIALEHNGTTAPDPRPPVVPKIIHQIFHNWKDPQDKTLPEHWAAARETCVRLNPDWDIKLWGVEDSRTFIEDEYPWFLDTYDSYQFPIQRIDVLRYFLLRQYGGVYLDLDNVSAFALLSLSSSSGYR
ncbi:hypothetical protein SLS62_010664 [Diatrype stigma]|uniref:Mannosyl phosphorylinositol ceramide synthase SUR1 n=1 Tax=Diatrype stigma TaxID=117547 RepID=A0AAN9UAQ7_9PEZI